MCENGVCPRNCKCHRKNDTVINHGFGDVWGCLGMFGDVWGLSYFEQDITNRYLKSGSNDLRKFSHDLEVVVPLILTVVLIPPPIEKLKKASMYTKSSSLSVLPSVSTGTFTKIAKNAYIILMRSSVRIWFCHGLVDVLVSDLGFCSPFMTHLLTAQ